MSHASADPSSRVARLRDRAFMLKRARDFFAERQVLEVDCPILSAQASVDPNIDLITALYCQTKRYFLHSSPEFGMKRLLAEGMGDIYQLSHVFRDGECGHKHNPEFTMAEWYRLGFSLEEMIEETVAFIRLFVGSSLAYSIISYRELFQKSIGIDYVVASAQELFDYIKHSKIPYYPSILADGKDALLNLILGSQIEATLGDGELTVLAYYPASQAALARKRMHGIESVAERFEVYYKGVELANGYHELIDPAEQRQRFIEDNKMRCEMNKEPLPIDENLLKALEKGLPDCSGVAVGFDRLMMLRHHVSHIADILTFGWEEA